MGGFIRKRGDRWQTLYNEAGRRRSAGTFATKREAQAQLVKILSQIQTGTYVSPDKVTLQDFIRYQWLPAIRSEIRPLTLASYAQLSKHIITSCGRVQLQRLTPAHVKRLHVELDNKGLAPNTIIRVHTTLRRCLRDAADWGFVTRNVADSAHPPRVKNKQAMRVWSTEQTRTFLAHVQTERLYPMWLLFATTGMRRGEVLGLRWDAIDIKTGTLEVRQTLVPLGKDTALSEPRTAAGRRSIDLDPATVAALRLWRETQTAERWRWKELWTDTGLVFTKENGLPYHPQHVTKMFKRRAELAGLPVIPLHSLRHSWATAALRAGENAKVVQQQLGHASVSITLDVYAAVMPGDRRDTVERVAALMVPAALSVTNQ